MFGIIGILCLLPFLPAICSQEQAEHREFQYKSDIDPLTGRYNFAYDTGNDNDIAHSMHMQYQDADGIVRGRYGYTDPRGKLRMVEYEAGPDGFIARGDVGPDMSLHDNKPAASPDSQLSSYREGDFLLDPAPVQMAGWNPEANPIDQGIVDNSQSVETATGEPGMENSEVSYLSPFDRSLFPALNVTSGNELTVYGSDSDGYDNRYPRLTYSTGETTDRIETESESYRTGDENQSEAVQGQSDSNVNNIEVDAEEIRAASGGIPVRRSADGRTFERMQEQQARSQPTKVTTSDGRRLFYRDSHSMEPHEHYYFRPTHDHDSETRNYNPRRTHHHEIVRRYYSPRQTHDHDAETRYYRPRQTHDHDAERRYYRPRQTHDHDSERRYYRSRQTHDHDAESNYYQRVYRNGVAYYRDRHSDKLHAHPSQSYQNHADHQHSDVHLYARYRNSDYPATAAPRQLQYIPSDKYHDKRYYWTYS